VLLAERDAKEIELVHRAGMVFGEGAGVPGGEDDNDEGEDDNNGDGVGQSNVEMTPRARGHTSRTSLTAALNYSALMQVVLSDQVLRNAFHAHLCEEHNVEPLTFIDAVDRWRRHFASSSLDVSHRRAKRIMKSFVGPRAPFSLPLAAPVVDQLIRRTARQDALTVDVFDTARAEVIKLLEFGPLVRFIKSNIWRGFVEDGLILSPEQYGRNARTSHISAPSPSLANVSSPSNAIVSSSAPSPLRLRTKTAAVATPAM
jgi:hypothetical protein